MNRHKQREYTFRLLFSLEILKEGMNEEEIDISIKSLDLINEEDIQLVKDQTMEVIQHIPEIDQLIDESADRWSVERIGKIELAILRVATFEMKFKEIPVQVAVNEAIEIAKKYGEDQSPKFVNGVLGQIVKRL